MSAGEKLESSRLSASDTQYLQELYQAEFQNLVDYAKYLTRQPYPEDIVQDTFLIASLKITHLKASENPVGWLYRTLQNLVKNDARERSTIRKLKEKIYDRESDRQVEPTPFEEKSALMISCQQILSKDDWDLLYWYYCEGCECKILASHFGLSESACRMRILRARRTLAKHLKNE